MLIASTFKNNDTASVKSKTGKVTPAIARAQNIQSVYYKTKTTIPTDKKAGILKDYGGECTATMSNNGITASITFAKGLVVVCGGYIYIEAGTTFSTDSGEGLPIVNNTSGKLGVKVDLTQPAGQEVKFFYKTTALTQDDLQSNEQGTYEFALYDYTIDSVGQVNLTKTNSYVYGANQVIDMLINGQITVNKATLSDYITFTTTPPTQSPAEGRLTVCVTSGTVPTSRYDRVIYLVV